MAPSKIIPRLFVFIFSKTLTLLLLEGQNDAERDGKADRAAPDRGADAAEMGQRTNV